MSFQGSVRVGLTVTGLNEIIRNQDAMIREMPQFRTQVHRESAEFFAKDAKANAHVITGKTKASVKVESATPQAGIISAGFGMPFEQKREGSKNGSPHTTFTISAQRTALQMPRIIKKHIDDLLRRHKSV